MCIKIGKIYIAIDSSTYGHLNSPIDSSFCVWNFHVLGGCFGQRAQKNTNHASVYIENIKISKKVCSTI